MHMCYVLRARLELELRDLAVAVDVNLVEELVGHLVTLIDEIDVEVAQPRLLPQRREAREARAQLVARDLAVVVDVNGPAGQSGANARVV